MSKHTLCLAMVLCVLLASGGCGNESFTPDNDTNTEPSTDPTTEGTPDAAPDVDPLDVPTEVIDEPTEEPVVDAPVDPGTDPFADPPAEGFPPACYDDPTICCSTPPFDCAGMWECRSGLCMWVCGDIGVFHLTCDAATDCDCYPAPVRCTGTWDCLGGTCWYFCDEG